MIDTNIFPESKLTKKQRIIKSFVNDDESKLQVKIRYDDECGNKHNTFSITGTWWRPGHTYGEADEGGCIHDRIEQYAPCLAKYIKWHGCTSEGPLAYLSNVTYCAGNRDYNKRAPGDISGYAYGIRFNNSVVSHFIDNKLWEYLKNAIESGVTEFNLKTIEHINRPDTNYDFTPNYSINDFAEDWSGCPFKKGIAPAQKLCEGLMNETVEFVKIPTEFSKGKERELDSARYHGVWPEATDKQLMLPKEELEVLLKARLPALMKDFKAAMEELGFTY